MSTTLPAITATQALESIKAQFPEEAAVLHAALSRDIRALGTDEVFALRDSQGEIRAFKQNLTLAADNGGLVQPVPGGPYVVSAQGYEMWAEATGTSVIFPKEVLVDNEWKPNPCVIRDQANRRILCITARAVAWRFTSKGLPQVTDWTHNFDTPSYRLIDLLGKAKKYPQAFRLYPVDMGKPEDPGTWATYPFDESTSLWVNTSHEEALTWFAQILNREKKAIDYAQTFARRNALKHLSALQKAPGPKWSFPIICWRTSGGNIVKWDHTQYAMIQEKAGSLAQSTGEEFGVQKLLTADRSIEIVVGSDRASDDDYVEAFEQMTDPEDQSDVYDIQRQTEPPDRNQTSKRQTRSKQAPPETASQAADEKLPEDYQKVLGNYQAAQKMFPEEYAVAIEKLGLTPTVNNRSYSLMKDILSVINALVDEGER